MVKGSSIPARKGLKILLTFRPECSGLLQGEDYALQSKADNSLQSLERQTWLSSEWLKLFTLARTILVTHDNLHYGRTYLATQGCPNAHQPVLLSGQSLSSLPHHLPPCTTLGSHTPWPPLPPSTLPHLVQPEASRAPNSSNAPPTRDIQAVPLLVLSPHEEER